MMIKKYNENADKSVQKIHPVLKLDLGSNYRKPMTLAPLEKGANQNDIMIRVRTRQQVLNIGKKLSKI